MEPILNFVFDKLLFPKRCVGCKKVGEYFCANCILNIKQTELVCPNCERPSLGGIVHPVCIRRHGLDGLWSLGIYLGPLRAAVQKLKYRWVTELADVLINIVISYWARHQPFILDEIKKGFGHNWVLIPVPLHKSRQKWRGFNQAALLAKNLSDKTGLPYAEALIRTRKTRSQVGLPAYQRKDNVRGAFSVVSELNVFGKNIVLVDDVWTTGSTLKECAAILKRAGASEVWALTIAR